jgi:hypothetical protein
MKLNTMVGACSVAAASLRAHIDDVEEGCVRARAVGSSEPSEQKAEIAGAAADVEHAMAGTNLEQLQDVGVHAGEERIGGVGVGLRVGRVRGQSG